MGGAWGVGWFEGAKVRIFFDMQATGKIFSHGDATCCPACWVHNSQKTLINAIKQTNMRYSEDMKTGQITL